MPILGDVVGSRYRDTNGFLPHFLQWAKVFANSPKRSEYMKEMKSGANLVTWLVLLLE